MHSWSLVKARFYTGIPDASDNAFWHHFWVEKLAFMGKQGVTVFSRPLRYRNVQVFVPCMQVVVTLRYVEGNLLVLCCALALEAAEVPVPVRTKLWTRDEYDRLVRAGSFAPDARLQLIQGEIFEVTPQSAAHATAIRRLQTALAPIFATGYDVRAQLPLALAGDLLSEPEPDLAVVLGHIDDYRDHHPSMAVLVVEVADTSLEFDRTRKAAVYAGAGIPEYWILNLTDRRLDVYRNPQGSAYATHVTYASDDKVTPLAAPDYELRVGSLLP